MTWYLVNDTGDILMLIEIYWFNHSIIICFFVFKVRIKDYTLYYVNIHKNSSIEYLISDVLFILVIHRTFQLTGNVY